MRPKVEGLDRLAIAWALRQIGRLLDLAGAEPFKARAYERGARVLERADLDIGRLVAERRLTALPGIGPELAKTIAELHHGGRSPALDDLRPGWRQDILEAGRARSLLPPYAGSMSS